MTRSLVLAGTAWVFALVITSAQPGRKQILDGRADGAVVQEILRETVTGWR